jgi:hypothetical protein
LLCLASLVRPTAFARPAESDYGRALDPSRFFGQRVFRDRVEPRWFDGGESAYAARRRMDFFVRHLLDVEPRRD